MSKNVEYVPGEINVSYRLVRNPGTMPGGIGSTLPGQSAEGYGAKITTDLMLQFRDSKKKYRVYCTCFSNAASHWILMGGRKLHLPTIFQSEIEAEFYDQ